MNCPFCDARDVPDEWACGSTASLQSRECLLRQIRKLKNEIARLVGELQAYRILDAARRINRE